MRTLVLNETANDDCEDDSSGNDPCRDEAKAPMNQGQPAADAQQVGWLQGAPVAMVFGVGLDYFFTDERKRRIVGVVRHDERVRFPERPGTPDVQYFFECLDYRATERKLSAFLADFQELPPEKIKPHQHAGVEFLYVQKGSLALKIASDEYVLEADDSIYFDSAVMHSYRRMGAQPCVGVIVTVP